MSNKIIFRNYLVLVAVTLIALILVLNKSTFAQRVKGGQCGICGTWYEESHSCRRDSSGGREGGRGRGGGNDTPPPQKPTPEELRIQELVSDSNAANDKGMEYYNKGDYDTALQYFEIALDSSVYNQDAVINKAYTLNQIGIRYDNIGDYENAVKYYEKAVLTFPGTDPTILSNLDLAKERLKNVIATTLRMEKEEQIRREEENRDRILADLKETITASVGGQLKSVVKHGMNADELSKKGTIRNFKFEEASMEAGKGFDSTGVNAGYLYIPRDLGRNPWKAPVVTNDDRKRIPSIKDYERKRHESIERRLEYEEKLEELKSLPESEQPQNWSVKVADAEQNVTDAGNEEIFYNFQIGESLRKK
ncbi:MAG: tetratricopeptide repeat protein [Nitrospira sp.]|nr:tetratricopeptide repeat protein [Nitrospira sp.]